MLWALLIHRLRRLIRIYASIYYFVQRDWNFWVRTGTILIKPGQTFLPSVFWLTTCQFTVFYTLYTLLVRIYIELSAGTLVSDGSVRKIRNSLRESSLFIASEARRDSSQAANTLGSPFTCCSPVTSLLLPQMESLLNCRLDQKGLLAQCGSGTFRIRSGLLNNKLHVRRFICVHERLPWSV